MVTVEELEALRQAAQERDALRGELRIVTVERDLLKERVQAHLHTLYAARSEVRSAGQKDLFLNEAEALAPTASTEPAKEEEPGVEVAGHRRKRIGCAVQPVINLLRDVLLESALVYGDETELQVLKEPGRAPQTKSYLWAQMNGTGPPVRLFGYSPGRGTSHALKLYAGMAKGTVLMTDGYEVYNAIAATNGLVHLGCWVHCRRYLIEADDVLPKEARTPDQPATQFIAAIGKLYAAEARARDAGAAYRRRLRARYSARVLRHIESLLLTYQPIVTPNSKLGRALAYLRGQWPKLTRYVDNGNWPIDNNLCENTIRPFVVGRKGWLFADTVGGATASANLYSIIETCKANGVDPYACLIELLRALPLATTADDYEALLPWKLSLPATRLQLR